MNVRRTQSAAELACHGVALHCDSIRIFVGQGMRALILCVGLLFPQLAPAQVLQVDYEGFTVWVDCDRRGAVLFHYIAGPDTGNEERESDYEHDPEIPARCQSLSTDTFQSTIPDGGPRYDVGHQVPANHMDGSEIAIAQTNYWTNLLPQTASMNRGAWRETEDIIECLRELVPLEVWGGPIWGANFADDRFVGTHGIQTPAAFWKVAIRMDSREANAWIIPNGPAPRSSLDQWLEAVGTVEKVTGLTFNAADKDLKPAASWAQPDGCDIS
jgi:endonuclease G